MEMTMKSRLPILFSTMIFVLGGLFFGRTLTTQAAPPTTCHATPDDGTTVFSGNNLSVIHQAITAAPVSGTVKIAGQCLGLPAGQPFIIDKSVTLAGGYTNDSWGSVSAEKETILDANQRGRVLNINSATVKLKNLTISGGQAAQGGGIFANSASLLIEATTIQNNRATTGNGGGIFARDSAVTVYSYSTIADNFALSGDGGGIFLDITAARGFGGGSGWISFGSVQNNVASNGGGIAVSGAALMRIDSSQIVDNQASGNGGGFYVVQPANARGFGGGSSWISFGSSWEGNSAANGGAAYLDDAEAITITNSTFMTNSATIDGGGIYLSDAAALTINGSQFVANRADGDGGGLYGNTFARAVWDIYLRAVDFSTNQATNGGALALRNPGGTTIEGTTFSDNRATADGGAAWIKYANFRPTDTSDPVPFTLIELAFVNNQAHNGGALAVDNSTSALAITVGGLTMTQNVATQHGGGIYAHSDGNAQMSWLLTTAGQRRTVPIYEGFNFRNNRANGNGGAVYSMVDGDSTSDWLMTSAGNRQSRAIGVLGAIVDNFASAGGGFFLEKANNGQQTVTLADLDIAQNSADYGAAIFNRGSIFSLDYSIVASNTVTQSGTFVNAAGVMSITQSVIKENTASVDAGAFLNVAGSLYIAQSLIQENSAKFNGGALANRSSDSMGSMSVAGTGLVNVVGSTFFRNASQNGAAFHNHRPLPIRRNATGDATIVVVNSTLAENVATAAGGAVWNNSGDGTARVEIVQSTIALNEANDGGGVFNDQSGSGSAEIYLANIINDNSKGDDCVNRAGSFTSNNHNADSDGSCSAAINGDFSIDRNTELVERTTLPGNHSLAVLPPQRESNVTGVGEVATCQGALVGGIDQLGYYRPTSSCDLGSVDTNGTNVPTAVTLRQNSTHSTDMLLLFTSLVILVGGTLVLKTRSRG
jgi:predicted outer membrane repeat protein